MHMLCFPVTYRGIVDIWLRGWKRGEKTDVTSHLGETLGLVMSCYYPEDGEKHRRGKVVRNGDCFGTSLHFHGNE